MYKVVICSAYAWAVVQFYVRTLGLKIEGTMSDTRFGTGYTEWQIVLPSYREADALASMIHKNNPTTTGSIFVRPV